MAFILNDRVKETSNTSGVLDFVLNGAENSFQTFSSGIGNGNTTYYAVSDGTDFEVGIGTVSSDGSTLARTHVLESSNADSKVNFGSAVKVIFCTYPASQAVVKDMLSDVATSGSYNDLTDKPNLNLIAGYPVMASGLSAFDVLMFSADNSWVNTSQTEISDGGNF